ncbi:MAG: prolyl oligopeptidase family serine peptidase [Planctomycetota bacterium]|nr:prolyl oligopeptidase family serine peptidase [Planctomycetota bacterium]
MLRSLALVLPLAAPLLAQQEAAKAGPAFSLENIFPEKKKPLFGPSASSAAFSHSGKYAAYLYRGLAERRHGNDLWIVDVASGGAERATSALVMSAFQAAAREVVDDRVKAGKKAAKKKEQKGDDKAADAAAQLQRDREEFGDRVGKDDADKEKAPRYGGVSSFVWSPNKDELLFTAAGDVFRLEVGAKSPRRLTHTKASERDVQYLPDGSGYTYLLDGALMKVTFGSHIVIQLDPKLPSGEQMTSYRLSQDGQHLVFLANKGSSWQAGNRRVNIARYRDRFMEVRQVPRTVSDDEIPDRKTAVYLHSLEGAMEELHKPRLIHTHTHSGPRDILPVPEWAPDSSRVTFTTFEQKSSHVMILEARVDEAPEEADSKDDKAYVDLPAKTVFRFLHDGGPNTPRMMQPRYCADSRHIVYLSEQSGFRHVHVLDPLYETQRPLTSGRYEVYPFGINKVHSRLFVTATKEHPTRQDLYALDLSSGDMQRLNETPGVYGSAAVNQDGTATLATRSHYGELKELYLLRGGNETKLTDSHPPRTAKLTAAAPEFFSYKNRHGHEIHGHVYKPEGWKKDDKRPLLLYVYGGPLGTRKQVVDGSFHSASYFFGQYMAREHGWVTCTIDPRGMSGYGGMFEKANFERVGKPQVEDLSDGVKHMIERYGVDPDLVAMHGWSFGGFQTQMCLYMAPEVFQVGIAGAGPTEWENYNSWYSTGTIGKSREGKTDLAKYSLLPLAKNLKGKLLLVHGMEDSNVLYQDTVRVYRELLKADKETLVELFLDPTGGHGLGGDVTSLRRYRKYEEFLVRHLGSPKQQAVR